MGFPCGSAGKESAFNVRELGSIPGLNTYERYALQIILINPAQQQRISKKLNPDSMSYSRKTIK